MYAREHGTLRAALIVNLFSFLTGSNVSELICSIAAAADVFRLTTPPAFATNGKRNYCYSNNCKMINGLGHSVFAGLSTYLKCIYCFIYLFEI